MSEMDENMLPKHKQKPYGKDRNRIKRLLRESFRQKELPEVDMVFLARQGVTQHTNANINARLGKTWEKLALFHEK